MNAVVPLPACLHPNEEETNTPIFIKMAIGLVGWRAPCSQPVCAFFPKRMLTLQKDFDSVRSTSEELLLAQLLWTILRIMP